VGQSEVLECPWRSSETYGGKLSYDGISPRLEGTRCPPKKGRSLKGEDQKLGGDQGEWLGWVGGGPVESRGGGCFLSSSSRGLFWGVARKFCSRSTTSSKSGPRSFQGLIF